MSAAAGAGDLADQIARHLVARGITISGSLQPTFQDFVAEANNQVQGRLRVGIAPVLVSSEIQDKVGTLVEEIDKASANGVLTDAGFAALRIRLCPGFWPFC